MHCVEADYNLDVELKSIYVRYFPVIVTHDFNVDQVDIDNVHIIDNLKRFICKYNLKSCLTSWNINPRILRLTI